MRVLYLAGTDFPLRQARGIQIAHTSAALATRGTEVTLVVGGEGPNERESFAFYGLEAPPNLRLVRLPAFRPPLFGGSRLLPWASRIWTATHLAGLRLGLPMTVAGQHHDLVFSRSLRVAATAQSVGMLRAIPRVFEVHFLDSLVAEEERGVADRRAASLRRLEHDVLTRAGRVVTLTSAARDLVVDRYGLEAESVSVVPSGTVPRSSPAPLAGRDPCLLTYAGQLHGWKGVETLFDVLAQLPQARLQVVGGTRSLKQPDTRRDLLRTRARQRGVDGRVEFLGARPYAEVPELIQRASVATIPLSDNAIAGIFTSPLKAFDYMWSGTPIVASDLPSLHDVLRHESNALLARAGDSAAFADQVRRLFADPGLCDGLARQAYLDVQDFTWQSRGDRLMRVFHQAVGADEAECTSIENLGVPR